MSLIHYIFVRRDLPLGVLTAMVAHAAGESAADWSHYVAPDLRFRHATAVILEAKDENHLKKIEAYLNKMGIQDYTPIRESSGTYTNQLMAIGLWPDDRSYFGRDLEHFQLLKQCLDNEPVSQVLSTDSPHAETGS